MQTKMLSRFLSVLLVLALTAGLVPAAWAAGGVPSESGRDSSDWVHLHRSMLRRHRQLQVQDNPCHTGLRSH